jgi:hypothetical protein
MFSENTECYLKSIKLEADGDKRTAHLRFFLTLASYELAAEAHPQIAERLFRKNGSSYNPVLEMTRAEFALNFPEQQLTYRRHPEYVGHEVMIPNVTIGKVSAQKVIAGSPDFSLIFTASFEILDKTVITDLVSLLHEKFFLTFTVAQPGLFDEDEEEVVRGRDPVKAAAIIAEMNEEPSKPDPLAEEGAFINARRSRAS